AATALISAINAATLKPTQCALWLKAIDPNHKKNWFYRGFDALYNPVEHAYTRLIARMVENSGKTFVIAALLIGASMFALTRVPTGFIPLEDQGYLLISAQLPDAASLERTQEVFERITRIARETPGVDHTIAIGGISVLDGSASLANAGVVYVTL